MIAVCSLDRASERRRRSYLALLIGQLLGRLSFSLLAAPRCLLIACSLLFLISLLAGGGVVGLWDLGCLLFSMFFVVCGSRRGFFLLFSLIFAKNQKIMKKVKKSECIR